MAAVVEIKRGKKESKKKKKSVCFFFLVSGVGHIRGGARLGGGERGGHSPDCASCFFYFVLSSGITASFFSFLPG